MRFVGIKEVCDLLSISRRTFERIRVKGFMEPSFYVGTSPRWDIDKLNKWLIETKQIG